MTQKSSFEKIIEDEYKTGDNVEKLCSALMNTVGVLFLFGLFWVSDESETEMVVLILATITIWGAISILGHVVRAFYYAYRVYMDRL